MSVYQLHAKMQQVVWTVLMDTAAHVPTDLLECIVKVIFQISYGRISL